MSVDALAGLAAPLAPAAAGGLAWLGWQSLAAAVVALPALLADRLLRHRLPHLRWALWNLVLLRLVLPADLSAPWGLGRLVDLSGWLSGWLGGWLGGWGAAAGPAAEGVLSLAPAAAAAHPAAGGVTAPGAVWPLLAAAAAWTVGAAVSAGRWLHARRRHRRVAAEAEPVFGAASTVVTELTEGWRRRLGVRRRVTVALSDEPVRPFTLGLRRPVICLPRFLPGRRESELSAVLGHEMAHVRRLDDAALRAEALLGALFWFHPVVRLARRRLADLREHLCDREAVAAGVVSATELARALLGLASAPAVRRTAGGAGALGWSGAGSRAGDRGRRALAARVRGVLRAPATRGGFRWLLAGAAVGVLLLPLAPAPASPVRTADARGAGAPADATPLRWVDPAPGARLTSRFGPRRHPLSGISSHHDGIDLAAGRGTPVRSVAAGVVRTATEAYEPAPHHGTVVVVEHPGQTVSLYTHLDRLAVTEGERVEAGQVLGGMGSTGEGTGVHLHLEIRRGGRPVDPLELLRR